MANTPPKRSPLPLPASIFADIAARVRPGWDAYWRDVALAMDGGRDMGTFAGQRDRSRSPGSTESWTPPRTESRTPADKPAPAAARKPASLVAAVAASKPVRDVEDFARAMTVGDSTQGPAESVFPYASGIWTGQAVNRNTGEQVANVTVADGYATIHYTDSKGRPTGATDYIGPGTGTLNSKQWNSLDNIAMRYQREYQAHSLDTAMAPVAELLSGMPVWAARRAKAIPGWVLEGYDRLKDDAYDELIPSREFANQQAWARQTAYQMRAQQLLDKGVYRPSTLIVPPAINLIAPPPLPPVDSPPR